MGLLDPNQKSTQEHLDIEDIVDSLVVLKNGFVALVLETTSINFDLLADREQDVRIITFAGLLNSLTFPIQIVIRTQRVDVSKYQNLLSEYRQKVASAAISEQVGIYQEFIQTLTANQQILDKRFYAIIPTTVGFGEANGFFRTLLGAPAYYVNVRKAVERAKIELAPKRDHMIKQFANMGLTARQLTTDELIKLFYSVYEPDKMGLELLNVRDNSLTVGVEENTLSAYAQQLRKPETTVAANPFERNLSQSGQITNVTAPSQNPAAPAQ
jgi:hypothetical protein